MDKKLVYIAGRITGNPNYIEQFAAAEDAVRAAGFIPLNPAKLPPEISNRDAMPICMAMIDRADAVLTLNGWTQSVGAQLEVSYCRYRGKLAVRDVAGLVEVLG